MSVSRPGQYIVRYFAVHSKYPLFGGISAGYCIDFAYTLTKSDRIQMLLSYQANFGLNPAYT